MTTRILDELNRDDLSAQAADAVRSAIRYYGTKSWGFNETATAISFVAGTDTYSLPADFVSEITVGVDRSNYRNLLDKQTVAEFEDGATNLTGCPSTYNLFADSLRVFPIPDQTYSCVLTYVFTLPELSDSASNAWIVECEEMIRMRAEADLLENLIRGEEGPQQAIVCRAREAEIFRELRSRRDRTTNSSRIRRRGYL